MLAPPDDKPEDAWFVVRDLAIRLRELQKSTEQVVPLLREVVIQHADPEDRNYNQCEQPEQKCMWCYDAEAFIELVRAAKQ